MKNCLCRSGYTLALSFILTSSYLHLYAQQAESQPLRIAVAGITHGHVAWILSRKKPDVVITGIYEPDDALAQQYAERYGFNKNLIYNDLEKMLDAVKPQAVVAFGSVYEHMKVVEACAPRHINVMVEKPLATTLNQALQMEMLAKKYNIQLLTDFETSWYPSTVKAYNLINDSNYIGPVRKVVIHDGHQGPKGIGVSKEFFNWLTDPVQNGGGALMDFGCYGANLMTYIMHGELPVSVTAVARHFQPAVYPKVEDEATIIVNYATAQCIIQASWNWPFSRKDMEVYGETGYVISVDKNTMRLRAQPDSAEHRREINVTDVDVYTDPFSYLADVTRYHVKVAADGLYSLKTNVTVVRILEAAKESAQSGKTVFIKN